MTTEHTPPPWGNSGLYIFHYQPHPDVEPPGYYQHIAMLYELMPLGSTKANANLITAAPELMAALIALRHEFEQVVAVPDAFTAFNQATTAIAKALSTSEPINE